MNFRRIQTIIDKEWAEVFKNRLVFFTVAFLPLVFTALPLGVLWGTRNASGAAGAAEISDLPANFLARCGGASAGECLQIFLLDQFMVLFLLMPLIIPVSIAAYSIAGEKTTRSLEPLLATPISTAELLVGKAAAAALPAIAATWGAFLIFVLGAPLAGAGPAAIRHMLNPAWLLAIVGLSPLSALLAVSFGMMVSSRITDPRVAEQLSAIIIVPVLGLMFGQMAGLVIVDARLVLAAVVILAALDVGMLALAVRVFERESILTKWK